MLRRLWATGKVVLLAAACSMLASSCATVDLVTGKQTRNMYAVSDDIELGSSIFKDYVEQARKAGVPIDGNAQRVGVLKEEVSRIAAATQCTGFPFEVVYIQTNIVNAMAFPGGKIVVFEGLSDPKKGLVKDDDELAAVLAHEVAHVTCRHSTEAMTSQLPIQLILGGLALYAEIKDNKDLAMAAETGFLVYNGLIVTKYSRTDEAEADKVGMLYMARAGYDPRAAVRVWKRCVEKEGSTPGVLNIFSTHPSNEDRYLRLEKRLPAALAEYAKATGRPAEGAAPAAGPAAGASGPPPAATPANPASLLEQAAALQRQGRYQEAVATFTRVIDADPRNGRAYAGRGGAHVGLQAYAEAMADFSKAIEVAPAHAPAFAGRGDLRALQRDFDGALLDYGRAIALEPGNDVFYNGRGLVEERKGELDGAVADFNKASQINPQNTAAAKNARRILQGESGEKGGEGREGGEGDDSRHD